MNNPTADTPSAPDDVTLSDVSANSVLLSWSPPLASDISCPPATYNLTAIEANFFLDPEVINTTNSTAINKTMSNLTQGLEYSFSVAGVDAGGRVGKNSVPTYIILDSEYKKTFRMSGKLHKMYS